MSGKIPKDSQPMIYMAKKPVVVVEHRESGPMAGCYKVWDGVNKDWAEPGDLMTVEEWRDWAVSEWNDWRDGE